MTASDEALDQRILLRQCPHALANERPHRLGRTGQRPSLAGHEKHLAHHGRAVERTELEVPVVAVGRHQCRYRGDAETGTERGLQHGVARYLETPPRGTALADVGTEDRPQSGVAAEVQEIMLRE